MSFHRYKWAPEVKEQLNGSSYNLTYDGCGGIMQDHYGVNSVLYANPTWGYDVSGKWVPKKPSEEHYRFTEVKCLPVKRQPGTVSIWMSNQLVEVVEKPSVPSSSACDTPLSPTKPLV